jgi:putative nucleotidyltransferase with HDIG domain
MTPHEWFEKFDEHLLNDDKPSAYFNTLVGDGAFPNCAPFVMLTALIDVPQSPEHHPEGNVWNHTMQVVDIAAQNKRQSRDPRVFMWAALLHDLGKKPTTRWRRGKYTAYDHDKKGAVMARRFVLDCGQDETFAAAVTALVRWHMQVLFVARDMPFADIRGMLGDVAPEEIALLALCDRLGRGRLPEHKVEAEKKSIAVFLEKCRDYMARTHPKTH